MKKLVLIFMAVTFLTANLLAATTAVNSNTVSPTLAISATIQKSVSLTLSTGTTPALSHCAVVAGGGSPDYTMNFGTVDALAINAGNCNKFAPTNPGTTSAIYWSDYNLTPLYTSQPTVTASSITAFVSTNFSGPNVAIVRSATANSSTTPTNAASFSNMATAGPGDTIANAADITAAGNGGTLTRFIGVGVAPTNGPGIVVGAGTATVTFTLTVN
jgi:hypothetical protein